MTRIDITVSDTLTVYWTVLCIRSRREQNPLQQFFVHIIIIFIFTMYNLLSLPIASSFFTRLQTSGVTVFLNFLYGIKGLRLSQQSKGAWRPYLVPQFPPKIPKIRSSQNLITTVYCTNIFIYTFVVRCLLCRFKLK